jgi:hypothetical protein
MPTLLFELDKLFMLLVLVPEFVGTPVSFPSEPDSVQRFLSIKSKVVVLDVTAPLRADPQPQRRVLPLLEWHHKMATLLFDLNKLFTLLVPELVV